MPISLILAYSLPAIPLTAMGVLYYVYFPKYYVDVLGVSLSTLGIIIFASRVFDAITDPIAGKFTDLSLSKGFRRKKWISLSLIPLALSFLALSYPLIFPSTVLTITFASFTFFLFWTLLSIAYQSWGVALAPSYDERVSLIGGRQAAGIIGTLMAALLPFLVSYFIDDQKTTYLVIGISIVVLILVATLHALKKIDEPTISLKNCEDTIQDTTQFKGILKTKPLRLLLFSYFINNIGGALPATLLFFYVEYVLESQNAALFLLVYFLFGFLCIPLWLKLAKVTEKKTAWILASLINVVSFSAVLFLGAGDELLFGILVALSGLGLGGSFAIPPTMEADAIDFDHLDRGERREASVLGVCGFVKKLAAAIGAGLALPILEYVGYMPGIDQSIVVKGTLKYLYAGIPCLTGLLAILVMLPYPINRKMHKKLSKDLLALSTN